MRQVLLVRHGNAAPSNLVGDESRVLTATGRSQIEGVGRALAHFGLRPEELWHSPLTRAAETAEILRRAIHPARTREEPALRPSSSAARVCEALLQSKAGLLMLVSHMPLLPDVAAQLIGSHLEFGTGTVAHIAVAPHGHTTLLGFWTADQLAHVRA